MNTKEIKPTKKRGRGRPKGTTTKPEFDTSSVKLYTANDLQFASHLFQPMKLENELDSILSTVGGLMPAVSMICEGGPGSGKTTLLLDILSSISEQGYNCLYVCGEMDQIGHYKYCQRIPKFKTVNTLFLKDYYENPKETLEFVFNQGFDVVVIDSIAEVVEMVKDSEKYSESKAESWLLNLQNLHKKGNNEANCYTTFINIQQQTKGGDFAGSNRLKHMTDAMCHVRKDKDSHIRTLHFSKNRDCDIDFKVCFTIGPSGVNYSYEMVE